MSHYQSKHMLLVKEKWSSHSLQDWKVVEFTPIPDGSKPYSVACYLTWDSFDGLMSALAGEDGKIVMADVQNFSNKTPLFLMGDIVWSC
ncbi:uncharacterized protein Z518_02402 [Rhinocladiella mackenziei CBS 650.93]|uniref:Uncharacterized protein n=1 Tax=Rhinocladiella mackenziei CBS 650.93 TaxID=1442369 RepID=A0A0D2HBC8_9EURO|nr:uncharacterized protein Z518_02402 [Rhinocladiella mackenziei CBS 650.93]KIX07748.1 hypothetical protein Z518_02402 [Rhinocladiella mackenziei CBS 650.93]